MIQIGRPKDVSTSVIAYPGFGYPTLDGHWRIQLSGVAWHNPIVFTRRQRMMIRVLGNVMKASPEELQGTTFQDRITPFMADADHRQTILIKINGQTHRLKKKTKKNGHFRDVLNLSPSEVDSACTEDQDGNRLLKFSVSADHSQSNQASGVIYLLERNGVSVVSDIDDTIKDSSVGDRKELLNNTFLRDFKSIAGMSEVYQKWAGQGARFHYVSSSPWQLFESLFQMNAAHQFPAGTMHLRNFRLRDQLLKKVIIRREGKGVAIRKLMKFMPDRKFILIGDSGEKDPEIYRKICRKFPGRVAGLFIRNLEHRPLDTDRERKIQSATSACPYGKFENSDQLAQLAKKMF